MKSLLYKPTLLGMVQDVNGTSVSVTLNNNQLTGLTFVEGEGYRVGQVGSFVKIPIGYLDLFGIVSQVGASAVPENIADKEPYGYRWMKIQLIGESYKKGIFQRGISQYPTIDDEVHLVSEDDLAGIYGEHEKQHHLIRIGHIAGAESIDALVDINKLVTRHSAIVGSTGSGKSTTVAGLLSSLSDETRFPASRMLILDVHGEYGHALQDKANIFKVNPDPRNKSEKPLHIPFWAMSFDELLSMTFGEVDETNKGFILEKITELKRKSFRNNHYSGISEQNLTVDTPIPFSIRRLWLYLHRLIYSTHPVPGTGQRFCNITDNFDTANTTEAFVIDETTNRPVQTGDAENIIPPHYQVQKDKQIYLSAINLNLRRPLEGLASKLKDPRYDFLFKPGSLTPDLDGNTREDLSTLMQSWIGSEKRITILDLSGIPLPIMNDIIGILLRILYDALFWARKLSQGGKERPLLVVMEEAHTYLNNTADGLAASIVQRIVKEGRKYGIGAMIVSQRPSEINPTILSQCGTFIALRLSNHTDRSHITGTVSDNLESLTSMLPLLRTGEALVLGEAVKLPMRTIIEPPPKNKRPDSQDPVVCDEVSGELSMHPGGWNIRMEPNPNYDELVLVWRQQNPTLPNIQRK
ncbi:ATP-binding protein [Longitalea arenae]|uniref:ATP-binding protein n=1 Tax=Longitalea arenae TaxID=2812558 RepID=UPI001967B062|nr:ATP-binding protein [Longitalea arenae]